MSTATATPPAHEATRSYKAYAHPWWRRTFLTREFAIIALLAIVYLYSMANVANFDSPLTPYYLFLDIAPILLIALPMTMVMVTGEIDLSVASVVGLSSVLVGILHQDANMSIPAAAAVAIVVGAVCGALNGYLVAYVGLPSLAVTIGSLASTAGSPRACSAPRRSPTSPRSSPIWPRLGSSVRAPAIRRSWSRS